MSLCGTAVGFTKDCDFPQHGGTQEDIIILDYADIQAELATSGAAITFDNTYPNKITKFAFTTASARKGYKIESVLNQVRPVVNKLDYPTGMLYSQSIQVMIADNKAETEHFINQWKDKLVVIIYKNQFKNEDGKAKYKVFGLDSGLKLSVHTMDAYANGGAHMLTFASQAEAPEKYSQYTIYDTDEATTDTAMADLLVAA